MADESGCGIPVLMVLTFGFGMLLGLMMAPDMLASDNDGTGLFIRVSELVKAGHAEYYLDQNTNPPERKWRLLPQVKRAEGME